MRIVFLSHACINIALFRLALIKHLMTLGHEVFVLVPKDEHVQKLLDAKLNVVHYRIDRRSLNPFKELLTILSLLKAIKQLRADLIHSFTLKPNVYGLIVAWALKMQSIQTITGLGSFYISNSIKAKIVRFLTQIVYRIFKNTSSASVFQNPDDMEFFITKKLCHKKRAHLIMGSGIDMDFYSAKFTRSKSLIRSELGLNKKVVLMVARAIEHKGVREFYALAKRLCKSYDFVYIGGVDKGNAYAMSEEFLQDSCVKYLGEKQDVREFYAACDLFVLPSYKEGLPRTILEAMSFAKPVVAARASGSKELIEDGYNGFLVEIASVDELEIACDKILSDDALANAMGKNSHALCAQKFSIDIIVKEYERLYACIRA
ncbi:MAG: galactosyltransferase [Deltaproteobacteria bacterium]|nr:MAG: galactosyltransferase [Deltaproteobacteria bacterium]